MVCRACEDPLIRKLQLSSVSQNYSGFVFCFVITHDRTGLLTALMTDSFLWRGITRHVLVTSWWCLPCSPSSCSTIVWSFCWHAIFRWEGQEWSKDVDHADERIGHIELHWPRTRLLCIHHSRFPADAPDVRDFEPSCLLPPPRLLVVTLH